MKLVRCAVCNEESWFADVIDGHCLRCKKTKITISPGDSAPVPTIHTGLCRGCGVTTIHQKPVTTCSNCGKELSSEPQEIRIEPLQFTDGMGVSLSIDDSPRLSPLPDNSHYKQGSIDPLQYVEAIGDAEYVGACILNVVKYVTRYRFKGSALGDLAKARDYVDRLIAHQKKKETL